MNAVKGFFGRWMGHLVGYVGAAAGIAAAINPTLLPPAGKLAVGVASLAVLAAHHGYTAGQLKAAALAALNASVPGAPPVSIATAAVDAATAALKAVPTAVVPALLVACMLFGLPGCDTVKGFLASPVAPVVLTVGVDVAVAAAEQHGVQATDINRIAKIALAADAGTTATLSAVSTVVNQEISKLNLPPLDLAAASALEALVSATVQQKLAGNADLATAQAGVSQVLWAVIAATGG